MPRAEWRAVEGVRYLWLDYDGATDDEAVWLLQRSMDLVRAEPGPALVLLNVGDTPLSRSFMSLGRKAYHDVFRPLGTRTYFAGLPQVPRMALQGLHRLGQARSDQAFPDVVGALAAIVEQHSPGSGS